MVSSHCSGVKSQDVENTFPCTSATPTQVSTAATPTQVSKGQYLLRQIDNSNQPGPNDIVSAYFCDDAMHLMHVHYMEGRQPHGWHKENKRITWSQGNFNGRGMPESAEATERAPRVDLHMICFSTACLSFSVQRTFSDILRDPLSDQ